MVVHIGPTPFFSNRGCHIRIMNEIRGLQSCGCRVILCTYGLGSDVDGVEVRRIWPIPGYTKTSAGFSVFKPLADVLLLFLVLKVVWQERVTIIHGHLHEGALIGWCVKLALFWRRIRLVMDMQGSLSGELQAYGTISRKGMLHRAVYWFEKLIYRMPDWIVCSSEASVRFLESARGGSVGRVDLVGDVVPEQFFLTADKHELRRKLGIALEVDVIIYSGSLLAGKGVDILLEALIPLMADNTDCIFVLVGYPKEWVEKHVNRAGLAGRVILPGEIGYFQLADWLGAADLAVDPKPAGSGEASGKILHYMGAGLPVVCFMTENNMHYLEDHGFYAADELQNPAGRAAALSHTIQKALADAELRKKFGALGRSRIRSTYSVEAAGEQLLVVYHQLSP